MNELQPIPASVLGAVLGVAYFVYGEANQEKESNCSYLAPVSTDVMATVGAGILIWQGQVLGAPWVSFVGGAVAAIHVCQWLHFKTPFTGREESR